MRFLFIYPSASIYELDTNKYIKTGAHLPPLGILYLSKILEENGHKIEVIDCNAEKLTKEKIKKKIKKLDVIGLTTLTNKRDRICSTNITKAIREIDKDIPIIIGGPHSTILPELSIKEHNANICVTGQAEAVINPIAEAIQGKRKLSDIPGIIYKNGKSYKKTKPWKMTENLDEIPFPARYLVDKYDYGYFSGAKLGTGKLTSIMTSRGCPYHCKFCCLNSIIPSYTVRSIPNVLEELDEIIDQGYRTIVFNDDNFLLNKKRTEKIMDHIISKDANVRLWIYDARADSGDKQLYEKMRDAGVKLINFGIESGNQDVLDFYNKRLQLSKVYETVKLSKKMGFFVMASFILGAPMETRKHFENTIKFAKSLHLDLANFYNLGYPIGSELRKQAEAEGKIKPGELYVNASLERQLCNFTAKELEDYVIEAQKRFFYNPRLLLRILYYSGQNFDFNYFKVGLNVVKSVR